MTRKNYSVFLLTPGNVDDRAPLKHMDFHKQIFGKLLGDRGYTRKTSSSSFLLMVYASSRV